MCDIGRFDYGGLRGEERLQRPLVRTSSGTLETTDGTARWRKSRKTGGGAGGLRSPLLVSAHARSRSWFSSGRLGGTFGCPSRGSRSVAGREKPQRPDAKSRFRRSMRHVNGALDMGSCNRLGNGRPICRLRADVEHGRRRRCTCSIRARRLHRRSVVDYRCEAGRAAAATHRARCAALALANAADTCCRVHPGVEKDESYGTDGLLQAASGGYTPRARREEDGRCS